MFEKGVVWGGVSFFPCEERRGCTLTRAERFFEMLGYTYLIVHFMMLIETPGVKIEFVFGSVGLFTCPCVWWENK